MNMDIAIINKTPHDVVLLDDKKNVIKVFNKSDNLVRVSTVTKKGEPLGGFPTSITTFGNIEGLPREKNNTYYIVSSLVKAASKNRGDLLVPSELVRNEKGHVIGCRSFGL